MEINTTSANVLNIPYTKTKIPLMKQTFLLIIFLFATTFYSYSQSNNASDISLDGFYIAKTGRVEAANLDMYMYLRFYKDGSVYSQAVSAHDAQSVSNWFGRFKKFGKKGTYQVNGEKISIDLSNKDSEDFRLEGLEETTYKGTIQSNTQLYLTRDDETKEWLFDFSKVSDTTKLKYASFKPEIKLPGDWKVNQILKSRQVFFINEDSTIVGIFVSTASKYPFYKETQTDFETAYAYYDWDSKYLNEERDMEVRKISENKEKAFVIWNAKDPDNDNNFLFARHKDLLYNFMVYDPEMSLEKQLSYLELLFEVNKD